MLASRPSDGWLLWLAPAAWLLTVNPANLFDVSFQLSFGAVAGLLVLARPLTRLFRFLPGPLPEQAGVTTAASISTAPISMLTFGTASLVSVPANLVGGFVLGPIMFLGMLSLLLGFVGTWLSAPLNVVAGLFIGFLLSVAHWFAALPWAVYEWRGVSLRFVLVLALAAEVAAVAVAARRAGQGLADFVRDPGRRVTLIAATALLLAAVLVLAPAAAAPPGVPTITFLDVGEGAATLVQIPHGPTILVDAGPRPLAAKLRAHGVKRVDLLVLSHGHADHTAGLADVVGSIPVTAALLPKPPEGSALPRIAGELTAAGTAVRWCTQPAKVGGQGWSLEALPSAPPAGEGGNQSENDSALVVLAALGGSDVLIPGDCEGDALARLDLPRCAVVELPHHGSRGGLDDAELEALAPRLGVVSVGPNTYGHPTPEMMDLLAGDGVPLLRTDQRGDVERRAGRRPAARGHGAGRVSGRGVTAVRGAPPAAGRRRHPPCYAWPTMSEPAPLKPAYLIVGTDRPKVRRAVTRLKQRVADETGSDLNISVFDADVHPAEAVLEAASTPGFTLGTRLLLVLNAHRWKAKPRQLLAGYLSDPMPDTCLAIEGESFTEADALRKAIAKLAGRDAILSYDLPKKYEMAGWVRERARAMRLPMSGAVAKYFLDLCGQEPGHSERLERELEKLALYCRGGEATVEAIDEVCVPDDEARIFDLMDAVGRRERTRAFALLETIFASGDSRNDANAVFFSLLRHVRMIDAASQLGETDQSTAAKQLGVHPFTAKKLLEQRRQYDRRRLARAYGALAAAETGLRGRPPATLETAGGVNHGDRLVVELALARMLS